MKKSYVTQVFKKLAKKAGVKINIEPKYGYAGQVVLSNGVKRYFRGTYFDINPFGAAEIAKDKAYSTYFLRFMGYPVIEGESFFTPDWCKVLKSPRNPNQAYIYAKRLGFPVIVKPNNLSQGSGVTKVYNKREFFQAIKSISKKDHIFLVQREVYGQDYRIVVLDNQIISAYERLPLIIIGDGQSSILQLLNKLQIEFKKSGRDTTINTCDFRISNRLKREGLTLTKVLKKNQKVQLLDNRNLSSGGKAIDVTEIIHPKFRKLCIKIVCDMGLRYCGLDLMVNGRIDQAPNKYKIIELNAGPGIDNYAQVGSKQKKIVEQMYLKVLKAMTKK